MSKKKRRAPAAVAARAAAATTSTGPAAEQPHTRARMPLPAEPAAGATTVLWLALMMVLAPALGVPHEEMLQDTLKSIVVSFSALGAAFLFVWSQRQRREPLRWHAVMALPLLLCAYALGSMAWSHAYLGGVEAIRWLIFAVLLWLGLNTFSRERVTGLAWGIHIGAVVASLWTLLQFWVDLRLFPQGPNPASTFVNRNFFAEFVVCALPFGAYLLAQARESSQVALRAFSVALVILAILMTGTRSALGALWVQLLLVWPLIVWRCRGQLACSQWPTRWRVLAWGVLAGTVVALGTLPTGNVRLQEEARVEGRGLTPLERGLRRTARIQLQDDSLSIRFIMWRATGRMIADRPLSGVGAGAWEVDVSLYQSKGAQTETDFYVHNEFLQLVAEYGVAGWLFLLLLLAYCARAAWYTWRAHTPQAQAEAPVRALALCSLLTLLIVSNVGFPWRMASTGALFALCLGVLAASDARLGFRGLTAAARLPWRPRGAQALCGVLLVCLALAAYITRQAAEAESKIVRATKLALTISASNDVRNPRWDKTKAQVITLIKEGIAINPHYRKITPLVADEMARWGDWADAVWIWESVLSSRPYVVALISNVARGNVMLGQYEQAQTYLDRAKRLQPTAVSLRSLEVGLLSRTGREPQALALAREGLQSDAYDFDLANAAFVLAWRQGDFALAEQAMTLRNQKWPDHQAQGWIQLGNMAAKGQRDANRALGFYRQGLALATPAQRTDLQAEIPPFFWPQLGLG